MDLAIPKNRSLLSSDLYDGVEHTIFRKGLMNDEVELEIKFANGHIVNHDIEFGYDLFTSKFEGICLWYYNNSSEERKFIDINVVFDDGFIGKMEVSGMTELVLGKIMDIMKLCKLNRVDPQSSMMKISQDLLVL